MPNFEGRREKDEICVNSQETQITGNLLGIPTTPAAGMDITQRLTTKLLSRARISYLRSPSYLASKLEKT